MALTKFNYNSFDVTSAASTALGFNANANGFATISPGSMTLIKTITVSSGTSSVQFAHGSSDVVLDNTYPVYMFKYINVHGANEQELVVDFSDSAGSDYDLLHQTTYFRSTHRENGSDGNLAYDTGMDMANSGARPFISHPIGNSNADESASGELMLFNPSSTTFVKHFLIQASMYHESNANQNCFVGGYANTTSAITSVRFKMVAGTIDAGTIKLYGIKDS